MLLHVVLVVLWCSKSGLQFLEVESLLLLLVLVELCCSNSVFFFFAVYGGGTMVFAFVVKL